MSWPREEFGFDVTMFLLFDTMYGSVRAIINNHVNVRTLKCCLPSSPVALPFLLRTVEGSAMIHERLG